MVHAQRRCWLRRTAVLLAALGLALGVSAQPSLAQSEESPLQLLIVDETTTLRASLLVNQLAQRLDRTDTFAVSAEVADVASSFADPLGPNEGGRVFDVILIVPRAIEEQALPQLWIAHCPLRGMGADAEPLADGIRRIQTIVAEGSNGRVRALDARDDALPAYFATLFRRHGWLDCGSEGASG